MTWKEQYDEDGDPEHAMRFLVSRGYTEKLCIIYPPTKEHYLQIDELNAINWLIEEWDWGWYAHLKA